MTEFPELGEAQLLRLDGPDARSFAHAQFCSDVAALPADDWQWSAWLDAKGRARYFFALIDAGNSLLLWLPLGDATTLALELRRFLFRSKVVIEPVAGWALHGQLVSPPLPPHLQREGDGFRLCIGGEQPRTLWLRPGESAAIDEDALARWRGCDIRDQLPLIDTACAGQFVPQALELARLGAISFGKGCYPGQEVAARLHFRGGNKRGLRTIRWNDADAKTRPGAELRQPDQSASLGTVLYGGTDAAGSVALAVMSDPAISGAVVVGDGDGDGMQAKLGTQ